MKKRKFRKKEVNIETLIISVKKFFNIRTEEKLKRVQRKEQLYISR